jgi:hypothetical protein
MKKLFLATRYYWARALDAINDEEHPASHILAGAMMVMAIASTLFLLAFCQPGGTQ